MPTLMDGTPIVPAPFMTITPQFLQTGAGVRIGTTYDITLKGTLVAVPPDSFAPTDSKLGLLLQQQAALVNLFKDGKTLEVYSPDGSGITKCNPRIKNINFDEGIWVDKLDYTISLEADNLYATDDVSDPFVSEVSENWQIEESGINYDLVNGARPIWQITHNVSAKGKTHYDSTGSLVENAWEQARDWVLAKLATSNIDSRPFDIKGELNVQATQPYNHLRTESVDVGDGSFSIVETWVLAYGNTASEDSTIQIRETPEDSNSTVVITLAGTIRGYCSTVNDYNSRNKNAQIYYDSIKSTFFTRAQNAVPWTTLSDFGTSGSLDYNLAEGTISYSFEYNDRPTVSNGLAYDNYVISKKTSLSAYETTVTVSGTITGRLHLEEPNSNLLRYQRAKNYFNNVLISGTTLKDRANLSGVAGLKDGYLETSVDHNYNEGTITYSYEFSDRPFQYVKNEYTTSFKYNREDARVVVSVEGTVEGLKSNDTDPYTIKYQNALSFFGTWIPQLFGIASTFAGGGVNLNSTPISKSRGDNQLNGTIQYSYEFNNELPVDIPGATSENLNISDTQASQIFASIVVIGKPEGPILQDIGTKTAKVRSVTLQYQMGFGLAEPNTDGIVFGYVPNGTRVFKSRDEKQWSPRSFNGSRTVEWTYV